MATSVLHSNNDKNAFNEITTKEEQHRSRFHRFMRTSSVADVLDKVKPSSRPLYDLPLTATIEEAFNLLLKHDILSLPVYQPDDNNEKKYITFVSALDLLKLLSTKVTVESMLGDDHNHSSDALLMPLDKVIAVTKEPLTILTPSDPLISLLDILSIQGTHRVLVKLGQQEHVVLSQMDLIRYFQAHNHQLGSFILDLSVSEMKSSAIHTSLTYKTTAAKAFLQLASEESISALPIIDGTDQFVGEISAQDIRGLNRHRWSILSKPVMMFLKERYGNDDDPEADVPQLFTCHDKFTLSQVMSAFVLRKAHRLWWMDFDSGELKGIITLTDILSIFAQAAAATSTATI